MTKKRKPDDTGPNCSRCKHWQEQTEEADTDRHGMCRRYPPTVYGADEDGLGCIWPMTEPTDLCGEFAAPH